MRNFTAATVEGFVAHDPSMKKTTTGKSVCTFPVAINHYTAPDAPPKVSYLEVETWEKLAEICTGNVTKGKRVLIIGELRQDRWEGKDGKTQSRIKLVGKELRFLNSGGKEKESDEEKEAV